MSSTVSTQTNNLQTNNRAVTIYLAGTGNSQQTSAQNAGPDGRYPNGELVSILASNDQGQEHKDWFFVRGLGGRASNGGREETFQELSNEADDFFEKTVASGWNERVDKIIENLKTVIATDPGNPPAVVNLTGWSRGGVTANMVANAMLRDPALRDIAVNIIVFDPVPGAGLGHHNDKNKTFTGRNVKNYQVYFSRDDRSRAFVPLMPKTHPETEVKVAVVPGDHGTGAGRVRALEEGPNETGPETGLLVRDEFEKQLTAWGVTFKNKLELTPQDIEIYHEVVKKENADYVKLGTRTRYFFLQEESHQEESHGGERCARYGNDQGHQGHDAGHAHGHTNFTEMMATKGFTAVNEGSFFNGGYFVKQSERPAPLLRREDRAAIHQKNFYDFMKNISLSFYDYEPGSRNATNQLKLKFKEGKDWREKKISGRFYPSSEKFLDGTVFYNDPTVKNSIMKHLDSSLDNFLNISFTNNGNYFLDKYKRLWGNNLKELKGTVADALFFRLITNTIDSLRQKTKDSLRPKDYLSLLETIEEWTGKIKVRRNIVNTEKLLDIADEKTKKAISSLVHADYSVNDFQMLDGFASGKLSLDSGQKIPNAASADTNFSADLLAQSSVQMRNTHELMLNNTLPETPLTKSAAMEIAASYAPYYSGIF